MTNADVYELYMLDLINADRASLGFDPLQLEKNLNQSAEDHSLWMLKTDTFSHTGVNASSATERMDDAGFDFSGGWRSAENIAVQSERGDAGIMDDVADLHTSLMNSSGHYANLMNPDLDYIGIGIEFGGFDFGSGDYDSVIVTQNFASTGGQVDLDASETGTSDLVADTAVTASSNDDVLLGSDAADIIGGLAGDDIIKAAKGADKASGGKGADTINGGRGADNVLGNKGSDTLYADKGADVLRGGGGTDQLFGGDGADRFVFHAGDDKDVVRDFQNNVDTLDLRDFDFANATKALNDASQRGDDVLFDFGSGDTLVVHDITLGQLSNDIWV